MDYQRTQTGGTLMAISGAVIVFVAVMLVLLADGSVVVPLIVLAAVAGMVFSVFGRLTVRAGAGEVTASFGWGWPSRTISAGEITSVETVRNRWYHGWGIRFIGNGWMYNVAGYDAVELQLTSGKRFRIGTDQPAELAAAIERQRR